jgi:hypothetical protein
MQKGALVEITVDGTVIDSSSVGVCFDSEVSCGLAVNIYLDKFLLLRELGELEIDVTGDSILDFVRNDVSLNPETSLIGYLSLVKAASSPAEKMSFFKRNFFRKNYVQPPVRILLRKIVEILEVTDFILVKALATEA